MYPSQQLRNGTRIVETQQDKQNSQIVFPVARRILLPLLLEIYLSAILLFATQLHRASNGLGLDTNECQRSRNPGSLDTPLCSGLGT